MVPDAARTAGDEHPLLGDRTVGPEVDDDRLDGITTLGELIDVLREGLEEGRGE